MNFGKNAITRALKAGASRGEKYRNFLYLEVMPEESRNAAFYERFGFRVMQDGVAMQICNFSDRR